jgi:hypothetical protein
MKAARKAILIYIFLNPLLTFVLSQLFSLNFITTLVFYYVLPSLALMSVSDKKTIIKAGLFSFLSGVVIGLALDYIFTYSGSWWVNDTIFNFRFLNIVPIEDILWGFLNIFLVVMFYEVFLEMDRNQNRRSKQHYMWALGLITLTLFSLAYIFQPQLLNIPHFYILGGVILLIIPSLIFFIRFKKPLKKIFLTSLYFFYLSLLFELGAVNLGHWGFYADNYLMVLSLGNIRVPFEELFFYVTILASSMLVYYEYFFDDRR